MSGVTALIDIYKMSEVSVEARIRLLNALGEIVNWELGTNATETLIKELVALLNSSEQLQDQWIMVSERLPEPYVKVLACTESGYMEVDYRYAEPIIEVGVAEFHSLENVTHWMPLPQLPEDKK